MSEEAKTSFQRGVGLYVVALSIIWFLVGSFPTAWAVILLPVAFLVGKDRPSTAPRHYDFE